MRGGRQIGELSVRIPVADPKQQAVGNHSVHEARYLRDVPFKTKISARRASDPPETPPTELQRADFLRLPGSGRVLVWNHRNPPQSLAVIAARPGPTPTTCAPPVPEQRRACSYRHRPCNTVRNSHRPADRHVVGNVAVAPGYVNVLDFLDQVTELGHADIGELIELARQQRALNFQLPVPL